MAPYVCSTRKKHMAPLLVNLRHSPSGLCYGTCAIANSYSTDYPNYQISSLQMGNYRSDLFFFFLNDGTPHLKREKFRQLRSNDGLWKNFLDINPIH